MRNFWFLQWKSTPPNGTIAPGTPPKRKILYKLLLWDRLILRRRLRKFRWWMNNYQILKVVGKSFDNFWSSLWLIKAVVLRDFGSGEEHSRICLLDHLWEVPWMLDNFLNLAKNCLENFNTHYFTFKIIKLRLKIWRVWTKYTYTYFKTHIFIWKICRKYFLKIQ